MYWSQEQRKKADKDVKRIIATGDVEALIKALRTPYREGIEEEHHLWQGIVQDTYTSWLRFRAAAALGNFVQIHRLPVVKGGWACCICNVMFENEYTIDRSGAPITTDPKRNCSCKVVFDPRAGESLIKALEDENSWQVRSAAASALGEIGDKRAVKPLCKKLTENIQRRQWYRKLKSHQPSNDDIDDSSRYVRSAAAMALGKIGGTQALNCLLKEFIKLPSPSLPQMTAQNPYPYKHYSDEKFEALLIKRNYGAVVEALKKFPNIANEFERLLLYDKAEEWYKYHDMLEEAAAIRRKKADMYAPKTEIHGDYVDDRDTIVKDSVVNKSSIGSGSSKMQELEKLKEMFDSGFISKEEMEEMKKEILGK